MQLKEGGRAVTSCGASVDIRKKGGWRGSALAAAQAQEKKRLCVCGGGGGGGG